MFTYKFQMAALATDIVVFKNSKTLFGSVLLIQRSKTLTGFPDQWALPGGFVDLKDNETFKQAASRELREEAGLDINPALLSLGLIYDAPGRDPRTNIDGTPLRVISHSFFIDLNQYEDGRFGQVKAGDDAKDFQWMSIAEVVNGKVPLAFDHKQIIIDAFAYARMQPISSDK